jgi:hypothetical protein
VSFIRFTFRALRSPLVSLLTASDSHVFSAGITEGMFYLILLFGQIAALIFFLSAGNLFNCFPFEFISVAQESASVVVRKVVPSKTLDYETSFSSSNILFLF